MATFGDTTAGSSTSPCSGDRAWASKFTLSENGDVTEVVMRFDSTSTSGTNVKGLIYSDSGGVPLTKLAQSSAVSVPAGGGLVSMALTVSLAAGTYWLGFVADNFTAVCQCDASPANQSRMESTTYASPATTWVEAGTGLVQLNIYATYTVPGFPLAWIKA